jgi:hypothetical protein
MASEQTKGASHGRESVIRESAKAMGEMIETGANLIGRGMAAGVEGMGHIAASAAEMAGLSSPRTAAPTVKRASRSTVSVGRSFANSTARKNHMNQTSVRRKRAPAPPGKPRTRRATKGR